MDTMIAGDDVEGFDEVVGEETDQIGALITKALTKIATHMTAHRGHPHHRHHGGYKRPAWMGPIGTPEGVSLPAEEMDTLPFNTVTLTDAAPTGQAISFPQRPFRGERLFASAVYVTSGGSSDGIALGVISPAIFVGAVQVGASQGAMPLSMFAPNSFGVRLSFPRAGQGTRIYIPVQTAATLGAGNSLVVSLSVVGRAVR